MIEVKKLLKIFNSANWAYLAKMLMPWLLFQQLFPYFQQQEKIFFYFIFEVKNVAFYFFQVSMCLLTCHFKVLAVTMLSAHPFIHKKFSCL